MTGERRKWALLAVLFVVLVAAIYRATLLPPLPTGTGAPARRDASARTTARTEADTLEVRLDALTAEWPEPGSESRNLFQFGRARPVGVPQVVSAPPPPRPMVTEPPPPTVPPIPLTLIGVVTQGEEPPIAVLRDGRGVYHGRAGDVIEGRYRILRITTDAVEMSHLDGRGRQMMRLGGS